MDRSIYQVLPTSILTLSSNCAAQQQLSTETIFLHTIQGTTVIHQTTILLRTSPSTYATACTIFHRFYKSKTLKEFSVWSVALGSVFLACKIEEDPRRMRDVILVFLHVLRRFRLVMMMMNDGEGVKEKRKEDANGRFPLSPTPHITIATSKLLQQEDFTMEQKSNILRYTPPMSQYSQLYKEWEYELVEMENVILRSLGFTLYWIPDSHPHLFLLYFCKVLDITSGNQNVELQDDDDQNMPNKSNGTGSSSVSNSSTTTASNNSIPQLAWNYCNDSYRIDLCVRFEPEVIACAAIHLAVIEYQQMQVKEEKEKGIHRQSTSLGMHPRPWWVSFIGQGREEDLAIICNAMLALRDDDCVDGYQLARKAFIVSLVSEGSFCDPGSYIWTMLD